MTHQQLRIVLIVLCLPVLTWVLWPKSESDQQNLSQSNDGSTGPRSGMNLIEADNPEFSKNNRKAISNQPKNQKKASGKDDAVMARISSLISHETLSNREVAEQLLEIAKNTQMSDEVRAEAMGHGTILDLPTFVGMASDTQLPDEMADDLLTHVINANDDPSLQLKAYKDFLNHPSPEVREEAQRMLAFMLEDDLGEWDLNTLIQKADAKLIELAKRKESGE
jgi:hypothetical protein